MNGNHVAHQLTADIDLPELVPLDQHWKSARDAQAQRQQETWERAQAQWFKSVPPLFNTPEPEPEQEMLTPLRVLAGCGVFLAVCVAGFSALLYFFR